jgi:hypothetical protein
MTRLKLNAVMPELRIPTSLEYVESPRFGAEIGIASGFETLTKVIEGNEIVRYLIESSNKNSSVSEKILGRILLLSAEEIDLKYTHPHDYALVTYLWILYIVAKDKAQEASHCLLTVPHLFWARILARHICFGTNLAIGA